MLAYNDNPLKTPKSEQVAAAAGADDQKIVVGDLRDNMVHQVRDEHREGMQAKRGVIKGWHLIEDEYYNRIKKSLDSRFNVPFPFMSGFLDAYKSKIDDPFVLKFEDTREAGYRTALKLQAFYAEQSHNEDLDWESVDLDTKQIALIYSKGINRAYPEIKNGEFKFCVESVDPYDYYDDILAGAASEAHGFNGIDNIFKTKYELLEGAKAGYYDMNQVLKLLSATPNKILSQNDEMFVEKQNRLIALGLDYKTYTFAGQSKYKIIESGTTYRGQRYTITWNRETGIWLRVKLLSEVFESDLWPVTTWYPKREAHNSWPSGPANDFLPVAVAMKVFLNQELDNRNKKNWNQRAYDPEMFPNPEDLEWAANRLVAVKAGSTKTRRIDEGIYTFQTPDLGGTINMVEYLDQMSGTKIGITNASQGQASEEKVGIYLGNQQAVSDRVEATAKQYRKSHVAIGRRFVWACKQYLQEPEAVKIVGENGVEWDKLRKNEINPLMKIRIEGGNAQAAMDEIKAKKKADALAKITQDPQLKSQVNAKWIVEQILINGEVAPDEISSAMDTQNFGNKELMSECAEAIEDLIQGKYPPLNRGANTRFVRKIMDYALDNDLKKNIYDRLMAYAGAHIKIAAQNMARQALLLKAAQFGMPGGAPPSPVDQANNEYGPANGAPVAAPAPGPTPTLTPPQPAQPARVGA